MNAYMGVEVQLHSFLTTALGGSDLVYDIHWEAGWTLWRRENPTDPTGILFHYE